ncbi:hypothetical protein EON63_00110 [archaeon]|nr:MAG: hypothetical protein EON63_00110 [archaeon]
MLDARIYPTQPTCNMAAQNCTYSYTYLCTYTYTYTLESAPTYMNTHTNCFRFMRNSYTYSWYILSSHAVCTYTHTLHVFGHTHTYK